MSEKELDCGHEDEPLVHQLLKGAFVILAGFLVRRAYDEQLINYRERH